MNDLRIVIYQLYSLCFYHLDCNLSGVRGREKKTTKDPIPLDATVSIAYTFLSVSKKKLYLVLHSFAWLTTVVIGLLVFLYYLY